MKFKKDNGDLHLLCKWGHFELQWNPFSSGFGVNWYIDTKVALKWVKPRLTYFTIHIFGINLSFSKKYKED